MHSNPFAYINTPFRPGTLFPQLFYLLHYYSFSISVSSINFFTSNKNLSQKAKSRRDHAKKSGVKYKKNKEIVGDRKKTVDSMLCYEEGTSQSMDFKETELRLGLPGGEEKNSVNYGKRGYGETVDLKLNLSSKEIDLSHGKEKNLLPGSNDPVKPPAKAQVVGWPPVRSFRKNIMAVQKNNSEVSEKGTTVAGGAAVFVKVSMDGAPYLRKVDLKMYKAYQELSEALCKMFSSFTTGKCDSQGMMDFMKESKLMDLLNGSDYVPTYEDKDGDWMLIGDVPWERLRIMKGTEAIGLAPRAVEKCKNRN